LRRWLTNAHERAQTKEATTASEMCDTQSRCAESKDHWLAKKFAEKSLATRSVCAQTLGKLR
jgi:hypothetical protein